MKNKKIISTLAVLFTFILVMTLGFESEAIGKKYSSFKKIQNAYVAAHRNGKIDAAYCSYGYTTVRTKKGIKKAMVVKTVMGMSGSLPNTYLWVKSGKTIKKMNSFPSGIESISKNRNYILTHGTAGAGMGAYRIYKFNKKKGKYVQKAMVSYDTESYKYPEREQNALKNLEKKCNLDTSQFVKVDTYSHSLW